MLKPYVHSERPDQTVFKVRLPDGSEGELVEDIVGYRRRHGRKEYHVKWLSQSKLTWEPQENLNYVQDLIARYHQRQAHKRKTTKNRETRTSLEEWHVTDMS
ncbi:hypothetical protein PF005_g31751 [Phytophthora fragariae]|uniref:Chromo domain-containing protein n=1 Tax=Phytophthora fragariae TaxID=53985 RepID=A0A6A3V4Z3_9STRA|nr:hypothetical protein PF003_g5006 [Phytophthora fragariae]KAE9160176.1 hypothetical protein PF005_g31751 [Phytophthora fragariae]